MDNHALVATWLCCCTPLLVQIGYPSTDACAGDSSCAIRAFDGGRRLVSSRERDHQLGKCLGRPVGRPDHAPQ
jgi:hypothetical protein